jgi:WD40 repeat protein
MHRPLTASGLLLFLLLPVSAQEKTAKAPIPKETELAKVDSFLKDAFKDDFDKAKTDPTFRVNFVVRLLKAAAETDQDPPARFVLYRVARDLAARQGDVDQALAAVEEMASHFRINILQDQTSTLTAAADATTTPEGNIALLETVLGVLADALEQDQYDPALKLVKLADSAAAKTGKKPLQEFVKLRQQVVVLAQKESARMKEFIETLKTDPDDAEASLEYGKYLCLVRGKWDRGLPLLAKGKDADLKALAKKDLNTPEDTKDQLKLGDAYWERAEKAKDPLKLRWQERAAFWYAQCVSELAEKDKTRVEKRLQEFAARVPQEGSFSGGVTGPVGEIRQFTGHKTTIGGVAISPDGLKGLSGDHAGQGRLWDLATGKELQVLKGHQGMIWSVAWSPQHSTVLTASWGEDTMRIWDVKTGKEVRRMQCPRDINGCAYSRDGKFILSGTDDGLMKLWDAATGKVIREFGPHNGFCYGVAFSFDGKKALSSDTSGQVRYWDLASGKLLRQFQAHLGSCFEVRFTRDGKKALTCGGTEARVWDLATGQKVRAFSGHQGFVRTVALSPDGRRVLTGDASGTIRLWDFASGKELHRFSGHKGLVMSVVFSPNGRVALSGGMDRTVRLWGLPR